MRGVVLGNVLLVLPLLAAAGCGDPPPTFPEVPATTWTAQQAPPTTARLATRITQPPQEGPQLPGPVFRAWSEAWHLISVSESGDVAVLSEVDDEVRLASMPGLEVTCRPTDVAVDGRGHACALVPCNYAALCWDGDAWRPNETLADGLRIRGIASAPGAILTWRRIGQGHLRTTTDGREVADARTPAFEVLASTDGGATWGLVRTLVQFSAMIDVGAEGPLVGRCAISGERLTIQTECLESDHLGPSSYITFGPLEASWTRALLSHGAALTAVASADAVTLYPALPDPQVGSTHVIPIDAPVGALGAWSQRDILLATRRELIAVDLAESRFDRAPVEGEGRAAESSTAGAGEEPARERSWSPVGAGPVGSKLVVVARDGRTQVR